jgi:hypothetical protein
MRVGAILSPLVGRPEVIYKLLENGMTLIAITALLAPYGLDVEEDSGRYYVYRGETYVFGADVAATELLVRSCLAAIRALKHTT